MIQILRDAGHARRGLEVGHSTSRGTAGGLPGGCMPDNWIPDSWMHDSRLSVVATWSDEAGPCSTLQNHGPDDQSPQNCDAQDRNAQNRGLCTCGPSAGSAQSAESDRRPWKAPWDRSSGSKGDNLARPAQSEAIIGNSRRQFLEPTTAGGGGGLPGQTMVVAQHLPSEANYGTRFIANAASTESPMTHWHPPMEQPARGRNLSEITTKNDNMQNYLDHRLFRQRFSNPLADSPKEPRSGGGWLRAWSQKCIGGMRNSSS